MLALLRNPSRLLLLCAGLVSHLLTASASPPFSDRLLNDESFWGDGNAELSLYDASEVRYGTARPTEVRHILVREDFAAKERVKADDWRAPGTYKVIKLNQIFTVPTGTYRYDQGLSLFWRVSTGGLIKFAHTTNDSCGLTYKQGDLLAGDRHWRYRAFTYWEGMSETDLRREAPPHALFYDELPLKLRLLDWESAAKGARRFEFPLMAGVVGSRADAFTFEPASLTVTPEPDAWKVDLRHRQGNDTFRFAREHPHVLLTWKRWDGSSLTLRKTVRLPYWSLNKPGDESLLNP